MTVQIHQIQSAAAQPICLNFEQSSSMVLGHSSSLSMNDYKKSRIGIIAPCVKGPSTGMSGTQNNFVPQLNKVK